MKFNVSNINSLVLVLVAFSSLVSMFALTRIDSIVHQDLYSYDLKFSYEWAIPYWTMITLVFAMGWFNIIIAIAFQFYVLLHGRKIAEVMPQKEALKPETTYHPPIEERPIEAEKERVEEPKPQEIKPAEEPKEIPVIVVEEVKPKEPLIPPLAQTMQPQARVTPQQLTVCQSCEAQNPVGTKFCRNCGSPLKPEEINCPQCNAKNPSTSKFCGSCGSRIRGTPQEYVETKQPEKVEERREQEAKPRETVETETQEPPPPAPEIEAETTEREETQTQTYVTTEEYETSTEETRQREDELTEPYPT